MEDKDKSIHELSKENPDKTYRELEKIKEGVCVTAALKKDLQQNRPLIDTMDEIAYNELKSENKRLKEILKSRDYTRQHDYKFLVDENKELHKEVDELKHDNKRLAHHIEDRIDKSRKAGM